MTRNVNQTSRLRQCPLGVNDLGAAARKTREKLPPQNTSSLLAAILEPHDESRPMSLPVCDQLQAGIAEGQAMLRRP